MKGMCKMKIKVSKEKLVMSITIGIACFALMLVMFMQFKVVNETDITAIETMRESELRLELSNWNEKYDELNEKYEEVIALFPRSAFQTLRSPWFPRLRCSPAI